MEDSFIYFESRLREHDIEIIGLDYFTKETIPGFGFIVPAEFEASQIHCDEIFEKIPESRKSMISIQACIAQGTDVMCIEAASGTNAMISSFRKRKDGARPIFYKFPFKRCNPYFDMPTIGTRTVELLIAAGVKGIVMDMHYGYIIDRPEVIRMCQTSGLFIYGAQVRQL